VPTPPSPSLTLPIPRPWNLEHFRLALQARRSRALLLEPAPLPQGCTALCVTTEAADLIIYDQALDSRRQLHAIGHQLAHLILGHQGRDDSQSLFPHLDPALTAKAPMIARYSETDESEADHFAALLIARANIIQ
jgi:Zn-dependent peptidase ImmA (M78 family)